MNFEQLIGKPLKEGVRILTEQGYFVALRYVDGALTYPVFVDGAGTPSFGLGRTVPKARLDVQNDVITGVEILPAVTTPTKLLNSQ
jgi:hypothetical protein